MKSLIGHGLEEASLQIHLGLKNCPRRDIIWQRWTQTMTVFMLLKMVWELPTKTLNIFIRILALFDNFGSNRLWEFDLISKKWNNLGPNSGVSAIESGTWPELRTSAAFTVLDGALVLYGGHKWVSGECFASSFLRGYSWTANR